MKTLFFPIVLLIVAIFDIGFCLIWLANRVMDQLNHLYDDYEQLGVITIWRNAPWRTK